MCAKVGNTQICFLVVTKMERPCQLRKECLTELYLQRSGFNYRSVSGPIHQLGVFHIGVQCRISHRNPQALQKQRATAHRAWSLCADLYHLPVVGQQHQDNLHLFPVATGWHSQRSIHHYTSFCAWGLWTVVAGAKDTLLMLRDVPLGNH